MDTNPSLETRAHLIALPFSSPPLEVAILRAIRRGQAQAWREAAEMCEKRFPHKMITETIAQVGPGAVLAEELRAKADAIEKEIQ